MPDSQDNVLIDFQITDQALTSTIDSLQKVNDLSQQSVDIYKSVNAEVQKNTAVTQANAAANADSAAASQEVNDINAKLVNSLRTLSGASKDAVAQLLKFTPDQIAKGFSDLGISVDDYTSALAAADKSQVSFGNNSIQLKSRLNALTSEMATLIHNGQGNTDQFKAMQKEAGELSTALTISRQSVKNLSGEAPGIRVLGNTIQAAGAAIQVGVGASSLFGEQNKDLEEVLVKVNSVMAINSGLQQVFNLAKEEGSISTAKLLVQEALDNAAKSESIIISTAAAAAQRLWNAALSANPIVLLVTAIIGFVAAIYEYTQASQKAAAQTAAFNAVLEQTGPLLEAYTSGIQDAVDKQNALLANQGAQQSQIIANTGQGLKAQRVALLQAQADLGVQLDALQKSTAKDAAENYTKANQQLTAVTEQLNKNDTAQYKNHLDEKKAILIESLNDTISLTQASLDTISKSNIKQFAVERQLANAQAALALQDAGEDAAKRLQINADLQKKIHDTNVAEAQFIAKDQQAIASSALIDAQNESKAINDRTSAEEIQRQNALIQKELALALAADGLQADERINLQKAADQKILDNNRNFQKQSTIEALQDQQSLDATITSQITASNQTKLNAQIDSIISGAAIEIEENRGKTAKIEEIEAKRDADIKQARIASIDAEAAYELAVFQNTAKLQVSAVQQSLDEQSKIRNASGGPNASNVIAAQLGVARLSTQQQLALIDQVTKAQLDADDIQLKALLDKQAKGLISYEDFTKQVGALTADQVQATRDGEKKKQDLLDETAALAKRRQQEITQGALAGVAQGLQILSTYYQQQDQAANDRLTAAKQRIQDELDAGAISAKEAKARQTELDVESKKLQIEQAKRNKKLAIFQAIIATATAVVTQLSAGPVVGIVLAAIAAALGAAQIAVIASQPLPQFDKGKKNRYQGWGEVAEKRPEIVEKDGRMFLISKPTTTWLAAEDKVYNPAETVAMMNNMETMTFGKTPTGPIIVKEKSQGFDYDKMGKAVGENIPQYGQSITEDGIVSFMQKRQARINYLNKKRRF